MLGKTGKPSIIVSSPTKFKLRYAYSRVHSRVHLDVLLAVRLVERSVLHRSKRVPAYVHATNSYGVSHVTGHGDNAPVRGDSLGH